MLILILRDLYCKGSVIFNHGSRVEDNITQSKNFHTPSLKKFLSTIIFQQNDLAPHPEGQFTDFFRTPPSKSQRNHIQNHKITRKITCRKHQKSQITEKLLENHTKKSLEITKSTKNHRKKSCDFKSQKSHTLF